MFLPFLVVVLPCLVAAAIIPHDHHDHTVAKRLPSEWFHADEHPVHDLFKRAGNDGAQYPPVGSSQWLNSFPAGLPPINQLPTAWVDALNAAVSAGKIPNIPQSHNTAGTNPNYPAGTNPNSPEVCSATYKCRNAGDTWDAPHGYYGTGFDDGPQPSSARLLDFLDEHDETATHFMIGLNIRSQPALFNRTFEQGGDIAVHGYNHLYSTTLSNLEVVAQLGWTMEIIHNSTGGRVPKFWRPPYGDSDNRVRAIAREVFGLHTIIWNQDTRDWSISSGQTTQNAVMGLMRKWLTGPKDPGLIVLEHEVSDASVQIFIDSYPLIKANGWTMLSVAQFADGDSAYQNADGSDSDIVVPAHVVYGGPISIPDASSTPTQTSETSSGASPVSPSPPLQSDQSTNNNSAVIPRPSWLAAFLLCLLTLMI